MGRRRLAALGLASALLASTASAGAGVRGAVRPPQPPPLGLPENLALWQIPGGSAASGPLGGGYGQVVFPLQRLVPISTPPNTVPMLLPEMTLSA